MLPALPSSLEPHLVLRQCCPLPDLSASSRSVAAHLVSVSIGRALRASSKVDSWMFDNLCFDCNALEKQKFNDMVRALSARIARVYPLWPGALSALVALLGPPLHW